MSPKEAICRSSINKPKEPAVAPPPPTTDTPIAITIPNVTTVAVNTGSIVMPPVEVRVPPPTVIQVGSVPSPGDRHRYTLSSPTAPSHRGPPSISATSSSTSTARSWTTTRSLHQGSAADMSASADPVDAVTNRKELDKIVEQIRKVGPKKNIVFVGWATPPGGVTYGQAAGRRSAPAMAVKKVSEALKKVQVAANHALPSASLRRSQPRAGSQGGNPPGSECNTEAADVDVYHHQRGLKAHPGPGAPARLDTSLVKVVRRMSRTTAWS